jgi:hypothetical protein
LRFPPTKCEALDAENQWVCTRLKDAVVRLNVMPQAR